VKLKFHYLEFLFVLFILLYKCVLLFFLNKKKEDKLQEIREKFNSFTTDQKQKEVIQSKAHWWSSGIDVESF
jgi:hypothetical protein